MLEGRDLERRLVVWEKRIVLTTWPPAEEEVVEEVLAALDHLILGLVELLYLD